MSGFRQFVIAFVVFLLCSNVIAVQKDSTDTELIVGVQPDAPFVMKDRNGQWHGLSVQLWRQIADELKMDFSFQEVSRDSLASAVVSGEVDMALCVQMNPRDEQVIDYTHTYYSTSLGVVSKQKRSLVSIINGIFTMRFLNIVIWLSVILLIVGLLIWLIERKANEEHFGGKRNVVEGIGSGFWWAGVTMTTIGYGDKAPITLPGRILAMLWMLIAMAITASLTAAIVSVVGVGGKTDVAVPSDLRTIEVGTEAGSASATYLKERDIAYEEFEKVEEGLKAVEDRNIDAFVHSLPMLRYVMKGKSYSNLSLEVTKTVPQHYAMVLTEDSPMREKINRQILLVQDSEQWKNIVEQYVPEQKN